MALNEFFEKDIVLKYIWRHFQKIIQISQVELARKTWRTQSYVNGVLNGKLSASKGQLAEFAFALGMSHTEWRNLVKDARKEEFRHFTWIDSGTVVGLSLTSLEELEFNSEDLVRIIIRRETCRYPTDNDVKTIMDVINMTRG
jgi:hypothetical protein